MLSLAVSGQHVGPHPKQQLQRLLRKKSSRRRIISSAIITANATLIAVVATVVLQSPHHSAADTPLAATNTQAGQISANPLDQVSSANIAETVARLSSLPEATAVTNQADSETTELSTAPTTSEVISKPQVVATSSFASNKDIKSYTTVAGDTITAVAAKFGVTSDSIRWSNNMTGDAVGAGIKLVIPPVTGIVYTVAAGDTPASLAAKFKADPNKIIAYNDAEISGLQPGERVLIPDGSKAAAVAVSASKVLGLGSGFSGSATYGSNGYDAGYCTWWVAHLRAQAGSPVPTNLGNAATWAVRAAALGLPTGTTPKIGAAVVTSTKGAGHVAYVTAVNGDGSITISEMNHSGWNRTDSRTIADDGFHYVY